MKRLTTLMIWFLGGLSCLAQGWRPTSGPDGASATSLAANDSVLLALVTPDALYRHTDVGGWEQLSRSFGNELYSIGNTFFARGYDRLLRSRDNGTTWENVGPEGQHYRLAIEGTALYLAVDSTIHRSTDLGSTWSTVASPGMDFFAFHVVDSVILLSRGAGAGVYRSSNSGQTWTHLDVPFSDVDVLWSYHRLGSSLYATTNGHGVFRSDDAGLTWNPMNQGLPVAAGGFPFMTGFVAVNGRLWVGTSSGAFVWTGSTWEQRTVERMRALAATTTRIYSGAATGISTASVSGTNWRSLNAGLRAYRADEIVRYGNAAIVGAGGYIYRSMNLGQSWTDTRAIEVERFAASDRGVYALGWDWHAAGVFHTVDGLDWGSVGEGLPFPLAWANGLAVSDDTVYVGFRRIGYEDNQEIWLNGGVYRSTNHGATWTAANAGLPNDGHGDVPVLDIAALGSTVLAYTHDGLYRSTDGGGLWNRVVSDLPEHLMPARMAETNGTVFLYNTSHIYRSRDTGRTWDAIVNGVPEGISIRYLSALRGTAYISTTIGDDVARIFRLDGDRWTEITASFPAGVDFHTFVEMPGAVLAGTGWNGVWVGALDGPSGVERSDAVTGAPALQSSPNPFGPVMDVTYRMPRRGHARVTLVSSLGREVATLHDGVADEGAHTLHVATSDIPSGIYRVRLVADGVRGSIGVVKIR